MPRRSGDFDNNDDIYKEIENHDKGLILTLNRPLSGTFELLNPRYFEPDGII